MCIRDRHEKGPAAILEQRDLIGTDGEGAAATGRHDIGREHGRRSRRRGQRPAIDREVDQPVQPDQGKMCIRDRDENVQHKIIEGVAEEAAGRTIAQLEERRDEGLLALLRARKLVSE